VTKIFLSLATVALIAAMAVSFAADSPPAGMTVPHYDSAGRLLQPEGYKTWVHVGVNLGIGYQENTEEPSEPGQFMNVYMQPEAYRHYEQTQRFPEKTMLALVQYKPEEMGSIARTGLMSGKHVGLSFAVKDSSTFKESWAYFGFATREGFRDSAEAFPQQACYQCHAAHAADDNVFVQFYPLLRDVYDRRDKAKR
jgi:hypothetical protein